jgi:hypothetical protein
MRHRAVVALEVVLDSDLPVGGDRIRAALAEDEGVDVDPAAVQQLGHAPEGLFERSRLRVRVHEDKRPPLRHGGGHEAEPVSVERALSLGARRRSQAAVQVVRPGVVRALQRLPLASLGDDHGAAVAADVDERAQRSVTVAHDDDRDVSGTARRARAGLANPLGWPGVMPGVAEDLLLLGSEHVRRQVPLPGQCLHATIVP